jgi:hydrogenase expression/formation protein HypE
MEDNPLQPDEFTGWTCPAPLRNYPRIVMGHGGGGQLTRDLIEHLFAPAFLELSLDASSDAATLPIETRQIVVTTDSFVVRPLFFPGGCIGSLAVHGTVNDLAMRGARPRYLTVGFILEEGLPLATLASIVRAMAEAARHAGVAIVTGDTKVVERGHGDGCYINMAGIGELLTDQMIAPHMAKPGDAILINGTVGDHGMAILSRREGLEFESPIVSDSAALHDLVRVMLETQGEVHVLRDPTRGGIAAAVNEIADASEVGMELDEQAIPVNTAVQAACEILGLDPLLVANEGKLLAVVPERDAERILAAMHKHPLGVHATRIGTVTADHPRMTVMRTAIGTARVLPTPIGEQLPRIC